MSNKTAPPKPAGIIILRAFISMSNSSKFDGAKPSICVRFFAEIQPAVIDRIIKQIFFNFHSHLKLIKYSKSLDALALFFLHIFFETIIIGNFLGAIDLRRLN